MSRDLEEARQRAKEMAQIIKAHRERLIFTSRLVEKYKWQAGKGPKPDWYEDPITR